MGKEILIFSNIEIQKNKTYCKLIPVRLKDLHIEKILASNKISFDEKIISTLLIICIMMI